MKNNLTNERLDQYANDPLMCISDEVREMARELLQFRNAKPAVYQRRFLHISDLDKAWTEWEECYSEAYLECERFTDTPDGAGYLYEVRKLYSAPLPAPEGYALVPVEPTENMLDELDSIIDYGAEDSRDAWSRMIAAAPKQDPI